MTRDDVQAWLDRYIAAWAANDPAAIGDLFSPDAHYRYHPSDDGYRGREAIVRAWTEPSGDSGTGLDEPGTWEAHYEQFVVSGDRAVAVGYSRYFDDATHATVRNTYDNAYLVEFDGDGRCRSFTEFFVERPEDRR
jgi:ketosteroid isomerase-like protein